MNDYQIYPIADNKSPKLSSDRLEYSLSNGLFHYEVLSIDDVKEIYNDVIRSYSTDKYPYNCDFYIPSKDVYIECNFHWTHGYMKYDGRKTFCNRSNSINSRL